MFCCRFNWYIKAPRIKSQPDYYIHPFHIGLWICILAMIIIGTFCGVIIKKLTKMMKISENVSYLDLAFLGFESMCIQMGVKEDFRNKSFRILSITFQATALFLVPAYGAVIISFLTVRKPDVPFRNVEEFVENGQYVLGVHNVVIMNTYFQVSAFYSFDWHVSYVFNIIIFFFSIAKILPFDVFMKIFGGILTHLKTPARI